MHFHSFVPIKYKENLVTCLFDRARRICSPATLDAEMRLLHDVLKANGYPAQFVNKHCMKRDKLEPVFGPERKPIYIRLPFLDDEVHKVIKRRLTVSTRQAFPAADPRIIYSTKRIPVRSLKDPVATPERVCLIYRFECNCGSNYIGRTERCLRVRMKEHIPKWLETNKSRPRSTAPPSSSIARHVMSCRSFIGDNVSSYFSVLSFCRSPFNLPILESLYISYLRPDLCIQKDIKHALQLPWV